MGIGDVMADDHRRCDDVFARIEARAGRGDWAGAREAFDLFRGALDRHFAFEEGVLFPALEGRMGGPLGPTTVMRMEHAQMREVAEALDAAIGARVLDDCLGQTETLLIVMQQHNVKEERILYPMMERSLAAETEALLARFAAPERARG